MLKLTDDQHLVAVDRQGLVLRLRLQNPPANLLSLAAMEALQAELDSAHADPAVRVIVIAASGKLFSAGHHLREMTAHRSHADRGEAFFEQTFATCSRLMQAIVNYPKPVIAEVDGVATAAGCQLVASCDLAIASDRSRFGVNGIDVGLFCSTPAVALTRTIGLKRAMEILLTGEMIDAAAALEAGLVNRVVPHEALAKAVDDCARTIAGKSPVAVKLGKAAVRAQSSMGLVEAYDHMSRVIVENMMAADAEEGVSAFFVKRSRRWRS